MSRRRHDHAKSSDTIVEGEGARRALEAASDLGNAAREFAIHTLGPLLSPERRAEILRCARQGDHPITVEIRLNRPQSIAFVAAGVVLARVEFETLQ